MENRKDVALNDLNTLDNHNNAFTMQNDTLCNLQHSLRGILHSKRYLLVFQREKMAEFQLLRNTNVHWYVWTWKNAFYEPYGTPTV